METAWNLIFDLVILLSAALVLGLVCERIGLSSILGYLVAGTVVGPGALGLVRQSETIPAIAEIGVALLLFTIGLEFSWRRLLRLGAVALAGGSIMVVALIVLGAALSFWSGLSLNAAVAIGCVVAVSSTAVVLRVLRDRNELDSLHGRSAVGILLLQDLAMVPLVLAVTFLSGGGEGSFWTEAGMSLLRLAGLGVALVIVTTLVIPRLLDERVVAKNRELPIILAVTAVIAATWAAYAAEISPALGAFIAGLLLADQRFADQMRADILPLRTLFMTVFFASIGMLADLSWTFENILLVLLATVAVLFGKTVVTYFALRPFKIPIIDGLATAICVSQVGEFSFVLASIANQEGLISPETFQLVIAVTLLTLLVTPSSVTYAMPLSRMLAKRVFPARKLYESQREAARQRQLRGHVVIIGFGQAGQAAANTLDESRVESVVVDLNPKLVQAARERGHLGLLGDARQHTILEQAHLETAHRVIVAVPDHNAARIIISQCKIFAPHVPLIARSRYHVYAEELDMIGADIVVDEENNVGRLLGENAIPTEERPADELSVDEFHSLR